MKGTNSSNDIGGLASLGFTKKEILDINIEAKNNLQKEIRDKEKKMTAHDHVREQIPYLKKKHKNLTRNHIIHALNNLGKYMKTLEQPITNEDAQIYLERKVIEYSKEKGLYKKGRIIDNRGLDRRVRGNGANKTKDTRDGLDRRVNGLGKKFSDLNGNNSKYNGNGKANGKIVYSENLVVYIVNKLNGDATEYLSDGKLFNQGLNELKDRTFKNADQAVEEFKEIMDSLGVNPKLVKESEPTNGVDARKYVITYIRDHKSEFSNKGSLDTVLLAIEPDLKKKSANGEMVLKDLKDFYKTLTTNH